MKTFAVPSLNLKGLAEGMTPKCESQANAAERSLTYRGKDGVFQVEVRDGAVAAIVKPHR